MEASNLTSKLPPQAIDLEMAVLGAMLLEKDAYLEVADILTRETFYKEAHALIFDAVTVLFASSHPVDILTVTNQLRQNGKLEKVGGAYYITTLTDRIASTANIQVHSRIVKEMAMARELISMASTVLDKGYSPETDIFDLIEEVSSKLHSLTSNTGKQDVTAGSLLPSIIKELERSNTGTLSGISTGFTELDILLGGWHNSDLTIIAARPGMGKTAFALHCARYAAIDKGLPVAFFSLEMSDKQLVQRIVAAEAKITTESMKHAALSDSDWIRTLEKVETISAAQIHIDDTGSLTPLQLKARALRMKQKYGIRLFIVDYLGLMQPTVRNRNSNRTNDIGEISRSLKALAKELDVPFLVLSQLNRSVESRPNKAPQLSDLRDSGDIEQDADNVLLLHRPEYYGQKAFEDGSSTENICIVNLAKQRNGDTGIMKIVFDKPFMQFRDL